MQDDYNRFIRNSIRQAQCNYEDIFTQDVMSEQWDSMNCMDTQSAQSKKCGGMNVESAQSRKCGGMNVESAQSRKCGGMDAESAQSRKCGCGNVQSEHAEICGSDKMYRPENELPVMVFIQMQQWGAMYNEAEGLKRGTLFPALDKPFLGGGCGC